MDKKISVIVPANPFTDAELKKDRCLCGLDVQLLMDLWPGVPHTPNRNPDKVRAIQRSLDWSRVAQIAAYLLQKEIQDAPELIDLHFKHIYEPRKMDPGRQWPPKVKRNVGYEASKYPDFSNILIHVNGARLDPRPGVPGAANLVFNPKDSKLNVTVIDGQHRINGAYLALKILQQKKPKAEYELPATIYMDLDLPGEPPRNQAQIFIDVNYYQKKVDGSLVVDLFPTSRGHDAINDRERAHDISRKLMLDVGPLVGMVQIPGIRYGVKGVVTLATLASAVERTLPQLSRAGIVGISAQTDFLSYMLEAWLDATGRKESARPGEELDNDNVVYQGRILVSAITLAPAVLGYLEKKGKKDFYSDEHKKALISWFQGVFHRSGLLNRGRFISRGDFKKLGFLGSGGIGRFRDLLWAAVDPNFSGLKHSPEEIAELAASQRMDLAEGE